VPVSVGCPSAPAAAIEGPTTGVVVPDGGESVPLPSEEPDGGVDAGGVDAGGVDVGGAEPLLPPVVAGGPPVPGGEFPVPDPPDFVVSEPSSDPDFVVDPESSPVGCVALRESSSEESPGSVVGEVVLPLVEDVPLVEGVESSSCSG
jgi:hypothetical protein